MGMRISSLSRLTEEKGEHEEERERRSLERERKREEERVTLTEERQREVAEKVADLYADLRIRSDRDRLKLNNDVRSHAPFKYGL